MIEYVGTAEPLRVAVIIHQIDDPRRREHLGAFSSAPGLF